MKRLFREVASTVISAAVIIGLLFGVVHLTGPSSSVASTSPAESMVKVLVNGGHGSGVHIGNGLVLTAAHVVVGATGVTVKLSDGQILKGDVQWAAKAQDVALIRVEHPERMGVANLECRDMVIGEEITVYGNPLNIDYMRTYGRVGGAPRSASPWESVIPSDISVAPGNSGGPVFDADGDVIGVLVGGAVTRLGMGGSFVGMSYFVPSRTICRLLARA